MHASPPTASDRPTTPKADAAAEKKLVEGLLHQDPEIVGEFLSSSWRSVRASACRLTRDPDLREDWTHDVLLHIVRDLAEHRFEYRWPGCFWSWFRVRTRFLLLNQLERHRREAARRIDLDDRDDFDAMLLHGQVISPAVSPAEQVESAELQELLLDSLRSLESDHHRRALELRVLDGMSYSEIAEELEVPINTARSWIRRGKLSLRERLAPILGADRPNGVAA